MNRSAYPITVGWILFFIYFSIFLIEGVINIIYLIFGMGAVLLISITAVYHRIGEGNIGKR